jgi:hypothetical protein
MTPLYTSTTAGQPDIRQPARSDLASIAVHIREKGNDAIQREGQGEVEEDI